MLSSYFFESDIEMFDIDDDDREIIFSLMDFFFFKWLFWCLDFSYDVLGIIGCY